MSKDTGGDGDGGSTAVDRTSAVAGSADDGDGANQLTEGLAKVLMERHAAKLANRRKDGANSMGVASAVADSGRERGVILP